LAKEYNHCHESLLYRCSCGTIDYIHLSSILNRIKENINCKGQCNHYDRLRYDIKQAILPIDDLRKASIIKEMQQYLRVDRSMYFQGIYGILCIENGRRYIGSSFDIYKRCSHHIGALCGQRHDNSLMQRTWDKYGQSSFSFHLIERLNESIEYEALVEREDFWIGKFQSLAKQGGFNLTKACVSNIRYHKIRNDSEVWLDNFNQVKILDRTPHHTNQLGDWVANQKMRYKQGKLLENQIEFLNSISWWCWSDRDRVIRKLECLDKKPEYNRLGYNQFLGLATRYRNNKLSTEEITEIEERIPWWNWSDCEIAEDYFKGEDLSVKKLIYWVNLFKEKYKRYPSCKSKEVVGAHPRETWKAIGAALKECTRNLANDPEFDKSLNTLGKFLEHYFSDFILRHNRDYMTIKQILKWADDYHINDPDGKWPNTCSEEIPNTGENWARVERALREGLRGIKHDPEYDNTTNTLGKVLKKYRGVHAKGDHVSMEMIEKEIHSYVKQHGSRPHNSLHHKEGETSLWYNWASIDHYLHDNYDTTLSATTLRLYPNLKKVIKKK